jgi:O-antigen/teichoic acid export membrane protein
MNSHLREILHGSAVALVMKVGAAGLSLVISIIIARQLGPGGAGTFFLAFTLLTVAGTVARLGFDDTSVRFLAAAVAGGSGGTVQHIRKFVLTRVAAASLTLGLVLTLAAPWLAGSVFDDPQLLKPLRWMALAVPVFSFLFISSAMFRGLKKILLSQLCETTIHRTLFIAALLIMGTRLTPAAAFTALAFGMTAAALFAAGSWQLSTSAIKAEPGTEAPSGELTASARPLFIVSLMGLVIIWSPTLLLGYFSSAADVGLYSVAHRTAVLVGMVVFATDAIAAPKLSALLSQDSITQARVVAGNITALMIVAGAPMFLLFIIFPATVLGIFGPEFTAGGSLLAIMAVGQMVNVVVGPVSLFLIMGGHEPIVSRVEMASASLCLLASILLIPVYGVTGAALATIMPIIFKSVVYVFCVRSSFGFFILPVTPGGRS